MFKNQYSLHRDLQREAGDQVKEYDEYFTSQTTKKIRELLTSYLEKKMDSKRKLSVKESKYESPNWALCQADRVGYERALRDILNLIKDNR